MAMRKSRYVKLLVGVLLTALFGLLGLPETAHAQTTDPLQGPAFTGDAWTLSPGLGRSVEPRVATSGDDTYVVFRSDWYGITFNKVSDRGSTPGTPIQLSPSGATVWEPEIAASGNYVYVVWHQYSPWLGEGSFPEVWFAASENGGASFGPAKPLSQTPTATDWYPKVAASGEHVAVVWHSPSDHGLHVNTSSDAGRTFQDPVVEGAIPNTRVSEYDVAANDTTSYVVWADTDTGKIDRAFFDFETGLESKGTPERDEVKASSPKAAASGGRFYVVWSDFVPGTAEVPAYSRVSSAVDSAAEPAGEGGGQVLARWGVPYTLSDQSNSCSMRVSGSAWSYSCGDDYDIDAIDEKVAVVWGGQGKLWSRQSDDSGDTFSGAVQAGDAPTGGLDAAYPKVGISHYGTFVTWQAPIATSAKGGNLLKTFVATMMNGQSGFGVAAVEDTGDQSFWPALAVYDDAVYPFGVAWTNLEGEWSNGDYRVLFRQGSVVDNDLEVLETEAVQSINGFDKLVAGKPTVVRVRIKSGIPQSYATTVRLTYGQPDGTKETKDYSVPVEFGVHDYYLPPKGLRPEAGRFEYSVDVDPDQRLSERDEENNHGSSPSGGYAVKETAPFRVLFVPIQVPGEKPPSCGDWSDDVNELANYGKRYIGGVFPLDDDELKVETQCAQPLTAPTPTSERLNEYEVLKFYLELENLGNNLRPDSQGPVYNYDKVVGVVPAGWFEKFTTYTAWGKAYFGLNSAIVENRGADWGSVASAHEIGHSVLGPTLTNDGDNNDGHSPPNTRSAPGYWVQRHQSITPDRYGDFMAYAYLGDDAYRSRWASRDTYGKLFDKLALNPQDPPLLAISGLVREDGGLEEVGPWFAMDGTLDVSLDDTGEFGVEYLDADGNVLARTGFDASYEADHDDQSGGGGIFSVKIPDVPDTEKIAIKRGEEVLYERERTPNAPTVEVTAPNGGETYETGEKIDLQWEASDADGDALTYAVSASKDGGDSWVPITADLKETHLSIDATPDLASTDVLFRVTATDGWNTTEDESDASWTVLKAVENGKIAFARGQNESLGIYTVGDGSSTATPVIEGREIDGKSSVGDYRAPSWSPDGSKLYFMADSSEWTPDGGFAVPTYLWSINPDGTDLEEVIRFPESATYAANPACADVSPDGKRIAYVEHNSSDLMLINADGTGLRTLANDAYAEQESSRVYGCPRWSPDGSKILYIRNLGGCAYLFQSPPYSWYKPGGGTVRTINADGTGATNLANNTCARNAAWSPDGARIAWDVREGLWQMNADGTGQKNLYNWGQAEDRYRASGVVGWSPDATKLVFQRGSYDPEQGKQVNGIWTMNTDGTGLTRLTSAPAYDWGGEFDWNPAWQPVPASLPPTPLEADAGGPYTVEEGDEAALDASGSGPAADIVSYSWDFDGDGEYDDATGAAAQTTFGEGGDFTVAVQVTDRRGNTETDTATVTVENAAPEISSPYASVDEEGFATLSAEFSDPGTQDAHSATVDWGGDGLLSTLGLAMIAYGDEGGGSAGWFSDPEPATIVYRGDGRRTVLATHRYSSAGSHSATITVTDDDGDEASQTVTVEKRAPNQTPEATGQSVEVDQGASVVVGLFASDPDEEPLTYEVDSQPGHGEATLLTNGPQLPGTTADLLYVPDPGYSGEDSFTFKASDGRLDSEAAEVSITVNPTNGAPDAQDDALKTDEDSSVVADLLSNDSDPDGDTISVDTVGTATHGSAELLTSGDDAGKVRYAPEKDYYGSDSFEYTVCDDGEPEGCDTASVNVTVNAVNDEPAAGDDSAETDEDTPVDIDVLGNDEDRDGDELTVAGITQPASGEVRKNANGSLRYTPKENFYGTDSFEYTVEDGQGGTDTAKVKIGVRAINDAPSVAAKGPYEAKEGGSVEVGASGKDVESGELSYEWDLDDDGTFETRGQSPTFRAGDRDGPGSYRIKVRVSDPEGASGEDEASVKVQNTAPKITDLSGPSRVLAGKAASFKGSATDPSRADTDTGFSWQWAIDDGDYSDFGDPNDNTFEHAFSGCGDHRISAKAKDKDGGVSDPVRPAVLKAYDAHFRQPLDEGKYNMVERGKVVPVKIAVGCGNNPLTNLNPAIRLLKGDKSGGTETSSGEVETRSSTSADTGGVMRPDDGGYIYNLKVPDDAKAGELYTVRVRPFGEDNPTADVRVLLKIK